MAATDESPQPDPDTADAVAHQAPLGPLTQRESELQDQVLALQPESHYDETWQSVCLAVSLERSRSFVRDVHIKYTGDADPTTPEHVDMGELLDDPVAYVERWGAASATLLDRGHAAARRHMEAARAERRSRSLRFWLRVWNPAWPLVAVVVWAVVSYFTGSPNTLRFWPWGPVVVPTGRCGLDAHPGLDGYLAFGWVLVLVAVPVSYRYPRWGEGFASAALALGTLAAALGGAAWYDAVATGYYDVGQYFSGGANCAAVPTKLHLASLGERLLLRASILVMLAAAVALVIRGRMLTPEAVDRDFAPGSSPNTDPRTAVKVTSWVLAGLAFLAFLSINAWAVGKSSDTVPQVPFAGPLLGLSILSFVALYPGWMARHMGRSVAVLGFGLAFGQLGAIAAVAQQHALGLVTRSGGNITVGSDLQPGQADVIRAVLISYAAGMLFFAVVWALSTWGERKRAPQPGAEAAEPEAQGQEETEAAPRT